MPAFVRGRLFGFILTLSMRLSVLRRQMLSAISDKLRRESATIIAFRSFLNHLVRNDWQ